MGRVGARGGEVGGCLFEGEESTVEEVECFFLENLLLNFQAGGWSGAWMNEFGGERTQQRNFP